MNEVDSVSCCVWTQIGTVTNVKQQNGNAVTDQKSGVCFIITDKRRTSSIINHGFLTLLNTFLSSLCKLATVLLLVTVFGLDLNINAPVHYHYINGILGVRWGGEDYNGNCMIYGMLSWLFKIDCTKRRTILSFTQAVRYEKDISVKKNSRATSQDSQNWWVWKYN